MDHTGIGNVVTGYANNQLDLTQSEAHPTPKNDSIFDFQVSNNGQTQNINSTMFAMHGLQGENRNDHLDRASQRFAAELDFHSIQEQNKFMDNGFESTAAMTALFLQSKKHTEEHDYNSVIAQYLTFTHSSNLLARDVVNSFKRSIISSLKLSDTTRVCEAMKYELAQEGLVRFEKRPQNVYGDYSEWEKILQLLSFDDEVIHEFLHGPESDFGNDFPTIKFVLSTLQQIRADSLSITDSLRVYLLTNIKSMTSLVAITAFLKETMSATFNATDAAFIFTACMADSRFTQEQFSEDLAWFMQNLIICPSFEAKCLFFMETKQAMMKWSQSDIVAQTAGRVRLRYRVGVQQRAGVGMSNSTQNTRSQEVSGIYTTLGVNPNNDKESYDDQISSDDSTPASNFSQMKEDSITGWSLRARIPPAISHKSRLMGYVLMGQTEFADPTVAITNHFVHDKGIAKNILEQKVYKPHADVIIEFLRLIAVQVTPFKELIEFRDECFTDFSNTDSQGLSWRRVLQLYITIYLSEDIWHHVWNNFCSVLSHQVLITVGNFRKQHVYNIDKIAEICMRGEESSLRTGGTDD
jgi:hypothetical protein